MKTKDYSVSTVVTKLEDYLAFILENYAKKSLWGKVWTIYQWGKNKITMQLETINVRSKTIVLRLNIYSGGLEERFKLWSYDDVESITIPYDKAHSNIELFKTQIINRALYGIAWNERRAIQEKDVYMEATQLEREYKDNLIKIAEDFLDEQNVSNDAIREAYIDSFIDKSNVPSYINDVIDEYEFTIDSKNLIMFCLFAGASDETKQKYIDKARLDSFEIGKMRKEMKALTDEMETDEWEREQAERLEPITT